MQIAITMGSSFSSSVQVVHQERNQDIVITATSASSLIPVNPTIYEQNQNQNCTSDSDYIIVNGWGVFPVTPDVRTVKKNQKQQT